MIFQYLMLSVNAICNWKARLLSYNTDDASTTLDFSQIKLSELEKAFKYPDHNTALSNEMIAAYSSVIFSGPGALFGDPDSLQAYLGINKGTCFSTALEKRFKGEPLCHSTTRSLEMEIRSKRYHCSNGKKAYSFHA